MKTVATIVLTAGIVLAAGLGSVKALPQYAQKEKTSCATCHVNPAGGGPLTERGKYYQSHGHSFKGSDPAKDSGKSGGQKPAK